MNYTSLVLTDALIDGVEPACAAWGALLAHVKVIKLDEKEFKEHIRQLPQHWRAVYTTCILDGEVRNGGHHQFFWNSEGAFNNETLEDLRLISAKPFVLLFEEALDVYHKHDYAADKRDSGNSREVFVEAYKEKRMEILDEAFYNVTKTIIMHLDEYIRNNRIKYHR